MTDQEKEMSKETEIAIIGDRVNQLNGKVDDLKVTFKEMVKEIHGHITREYDTKVKIGYLELEKKITGETDTKISESMDNVRTTIKTWSSILVATVILTAGAITFINTSKESGKDESLITIEQATSLYETVTREVTKSNKAYLKATKTTGIKSETESIE